MTDPIDQLRAAFVTEAALDPQQLVEKVANLTIQVRDGDSAAADSLVIAARVLDTRYDRGRPTGGAHHSPRDLHLAEADGPLTLAEAQHHAVAMMNTMSGVGNRRGSMFASASTRWIRTIFADYSEANGWPIPKMLGSYQLATLPRELPDDDQARVVVFHTLKGGVSSLLLAIQDDDQEKTGKALEHLYGRIVHGKPFPWEPGGWNGD